MSGTDVAYLATSSARPALCYRGPGPVASDRRWAGARDRRTLFRPGESDTERHRDTETQRRDSYTHRPTDPHTHTKKTPPVHSRTEQIIPYAPLNEPNRPTPSLTSSPHRPLLNITLTPKEPNLSSPLLTVALHPPPSGLVRALAHGRAPHPRRHGCLPLAPPGPRTPLSRPRPVGLQGLCLWPRWVVPR
eukprot:2002590-Rhodomonas_salina.1